MMEYEYSAYEEEDQSMREREEQSEAEFAKQQHISQLLEIAHDFAKPIIVFLRWAGFSDSDHKFILAGVAENVLKELAKQEENE